MDRLAQNITMALRKKAVFSLLFTKLPHWSPDPKSSFTLILGLPPESDRDFAGGLKVELQMRSDVTRLLTCF